MKKHHGHGNSYIKKYLTGTCLYFQRLSPLSAWRETWQQADVILERLTHPDPQAAGIASELGMGFLNPQGPLPVTHPLQQSHTSSFLQIVLGRGD